MKDAAVPPGTDTAHMKTSLVRTLTGVALLGTLLSGCTPLIPRRQADYSEPSAECRAVYAPYANGDSRRPPDLGASACWQRSVESYPDAGYELVFTEFDDQGWTARSNSETVDRLESTLERLRHIQKRAGGQALSLVVYVHGWRHDASANDADVIEFRKLLHSLARQERMASEGKQIVGLYVGWRGQSIDMPLIDTALTFWDRKATAERVASGSVRELFSRLDQWRDTLSNQDCTSSGTAQLATKDKNYSPGNCVHMLTIGHSMGGLIVLQSMSANMVRLASAAVENQASHQSQPGVANLSPYMPRQGDLVIVVNAALEGARHEALHQATRRHNLQYRRDQLPVLISVTSDADLATRVAFPAARILSTVLQPTPTRSQWRATVLTAGHDDRYLTHDLVKSSPSCAEMSKDGDKTPSTELLQAEKSQITRRVQEIRDGRSAADARHYGQEEHFCNGLTLKARPENWSPAGNPVWIVHTTKDVIENHGNIYNPHFLSFVRTVYGQIISVLVKTREILWPLLEQVG
jgi:pimeloyl-ACP methyl ester carboxylesterase